MPIYQVWVYIENGDTADSDIELTTQVKTDSEDRDEIRRIGIEKIEAENPGFNYMKGHRWAVSKIVG